MILNWAKTRMALFLAGSHTDYPTYFMLGSGSGTVSTTQTELIYPWDRQEITVAVGSNAYKVKYVGDWNSVEMSGNQLTEWGMCISGATTIGSIWSRTAMANAIDFDGTTELRIEETWEHY